MSSTVEITSSAQIESETATARWFMFGLSWLALSLPWWWTEFPPLSDFPQQLAQLRIFFEMNTGANALYTIDWYTPNKLIYGLIAVCWKIFPISWVGRSTMLLLALVWAAAHHWLAWKKQVSSAAATLACLFFFAHSMYWGYLSFLIGWPLFLSWFSFANEKPKEDSSLLSQWVLGCALGLLLYYAHALWFAAALLWFPVGILLARSSWKVTILRATSLIPALTLTLFWQLAHKSTFYAKGGALWDLSVLEKLSPQWLRLFGMGHLETTLSVVVFGAVVSVWMVGFALSRKAWRRDKHLPFLLAGMFFLGLYLILPRKFNHTLSFNRRWLFAAFSMISLALPGLILRQKNVFRAIAVILLAVFCGHTAYSWTQFEQHSLKGFKQSLSRLPHNQRVMGLDFVKYHKDFTGTRYIKHLESRPFLHMYAFAQVYKGGKLNFSFAEFPTLLVRYKKRKRPAWIPGLPAHSDRILFQQGRRLGVHYPSILQFDYLIIHGGQRIHRIFGSFPFLTLVSGKQPWRLYKVKRRTKMIQKMKRK